MSVGDNRTSAPQGQEVTGAMDNPDKLVDQFRDYRFRMGVVTERDLIIIFRVSDVTIRQWEARGLQSFKPGTSKKLFLSADVAEFLARRETFSGKPRRGRKGPDNGKKTTKGSDKTKP